MKKKIVLSCIFLLILIGGYLAFQIDNGSDNATSEEKSTETIPKPLSKQQATQINREFYSHQKVQQHAEIDVVGYPTTFSKLVNSGKLTITGEVRGLDSFVDQSHPYTVAKVLVRDVLHGDKTKTNHEIRVMFLGGNITKKQLYSTVADKEFMKNNADTNSDEIVTVEYPGNRLPKAGDQIAVIISKNPQGANHISGEVWSPVFANKGIFFRESDGKYRRTSEINSIGGGTNESGQFSQNDQNKLDDQKMNSGMNDLIDKSLRKD